jgi:hypothetical protein
MSNGKRKKSVAKRYGDFPDKWEDWHIRLPDAKDQLRIIDLYRRSGCRSKSEFARARLLGESFKVITVDKSAVEYYRKLSSLSAQVHKIGVNYNQLVRILHTTERLKTFETILKDIYRLTKELLDLQKQAVELTIDYRKKE